MKGTWEGYDKNETLKKHVILLNETSMLCIELLMLLLCPQPSNNNTLKITSQKKCEWLIKQNTI